MLKEPPKAALLAYEAGSGPRPERQALVWLTNPPKGDLYEAVVALGDSVQPAGSSSSMSSSRDVLRAWKLVSLWGGREWGVSLQMQCATSSS
jgi:hypothetical protein